MRSAMLLLVSNATRVYDDDEGDDEGNSSLTERGEDALREKLNSVARLCESSARMKAKVKEFIIASSSRNEQNFLFDEDGRGEETEIFAAVSWFPPVVDKKEDDGGPGLVPWTKACSSSLSLSSSSASSNDASVGERLRLTRSKRSMRAKKTAEDLFNEEVQTPTKKKKTGGGKRVGTRDGENEGVLMTSLQRRAATEAMKLVDQVKRKELSAMDIVCVVPIVLANDDDDDDDANGALFDMNDPNKWPKSLVLAHGVVKRAKEKLGGEKVRVKIVPVYIVADEEDEEDDRRKTSIDSKASEKRTAREALINARLEHVSNIWGFTNTVVGSSRAEPVTVSDASVMWRGKLLLGGGLKTKLSSSAKNKNKSKNNSGKYKTHDRCIATVEVSRECLQCIMPFLPMEETSLDIVDNGEEVNEERNGETKAISKKTSVSKKTTTTTTTMTTKNKKSNYISRKNEGGKDEDEEETVLKINDIVLMSAIDAIDIDSSEAPKHVSFSPYPPSESDVNNFASNWMSAYASFCAKKHDEGVPGECPVLLCSFAKAMPMVVASDKNGSVGTKEKGGKAAALLKHTNKYFPVQSRDERVFVLAPVFSKTKTTTSVTFRLVKLVDPRSALERRVLFESGNGDGSMDCYSSQAAPLALPGSNNRRLSAEEERVDEALKTVARMVVARGRGGKGEDGSDDSKSNEASNEDETFTKISGVIDDYFAKRTRCRGGKASEEDESMREYCIAWMRFLYLSKKDASAITITPSTNVLSSTRHHQLSTKSNGEKRNDEEAERNEWRRFYDALEKSSKETADDIRHDVSLVRVLHSAAMDCERKLENSETVSRLLRSRTPSTVYNNASLKRGAGGNEDGKKRKKTGEKKGAAATKKAKKNTTTTTATLKTTTTATASKDVSDKLAKLRGGVGGVVAGGLKKHATYANNPTTTNTTNSSAEEMRKRKLKAATMAHNTTTIASGMRYNRSNGPSNGSVLVAAATMSTDEASLEAWKYGMHRTAANAQGPTSFSGLGLNNNNNTNTASLSQQRPSESGAGSGAIGARGTIMCPNCNADLKVSGGMKFCCFCGGTLH
jgi:hypothetical protein